MRASQEVLDVARYLRRVRPLDPEEIQTYLSTPTHPAVIREQLRAVAVGLGIKEREDGCFVPVEETALDLAFDGVERLPPDHVARLERTLSASIGPEWASGESGEKLRVTLRETKASYLAGEPVEYDETTALAYACYHLPAYYAAVQYPLAALAAAELVPRRLRVLDIGAGVGGPALGVHDLLGPEAVVEYHAVEPSAAAAVFEEMVADVRPEFQTTLHRVPAEEFDAARALDDRPIGSGPPEFDLIVFANVLSELGDPVAVTRRYAELLAPEGTMLLVAPADRATATGLRAVERALVDDGPLGLFAPTLRLWDGAQPTASTWSFVRQPALEVPRFQRALDAPAGSEGTFLHPEVQYAFALLRRDGARTSDVRPSVQKHARLADAEMHVTERLDLLAVKLSPNLAAEEGSNPVFLIGDGSEDVPHYAVVANTTALNHPLVDAAYGAVLSFENALLLWNDDEAAYNLVVDDQTLVETLR